MNGFIKPVSSLVLPLAALGMFAGWTYAADVKPELKLQSKNSAQKQTQSLRSPARNVSAVTKNVETFDQGSTTAELPPLPTTSNSVKTVANFQTMESDQKSAVDSPSTKINLLASTSGPCVTPGVPNCTDTVGNPLTRPFTPGSPATSPTPLPESTSSTPDSLAPLPPDLRTEQSPLSTQTPQTSNPPQNTNLPPQNSLAGNGQDVASSDTTSLVTPFLGDFFGGSLYSSTTSAQTSVGELVHSTNSNEYYQLANYHGQLPGQFQTIGGPITSNPSDGSINLPGHGHVTATPLSYQSVLFNPPASPPNGFPNPQSVEVFSARGQIRTGGLDPALITGRTKLAEGASPIPRDRVFFNYSTFQAVYLSSAPVAVNRYTPGFEKTFFNGNASIEVRVPFASTLSSNIDTSTGAPNPTDMQFGNMTIYNKALLYQDRTAAYSAGLGLTLPTANNINVYSGSTQLLHVQNNAVHLLPFLGGVYTPNDKFYSQGILQFDLDTNGNSVNSYTNSQGFVTSDSQKVGTFRDAAFIYASVSTGYWLYRSPTPGMFGITGFSPVAELHYNRSLTNGNVIYQNINQTATPVFGQSFSNVEVLNAVVGANMIMGNDKILSMGYSTPLGMGVDKQFAYEFRVMFNWYFGGGNSSPLTRVGRAQF